LSFRKTLGILLIIAFILAIFPVVERWKVEEANKDIKLLFDDHGLFKLAKKTETSPEIVFSRLQQGHPGVAISPWTPAKMWERGLVYFWPTRGFEPHIPIPENVGDGRLSDLDGFYVYVENEKIKEFLFSHLPLEFAPLQLTGESYWVPEKDSENNLFGNLPLNIHQDDLARLRKTDWQFTARPHSDQNKGEADLVEVLQELEPVEGLLFAGSEAWGYPDNIERTAEIIQEKDLYLGFIEPFLARQLGMRELGFKVEDRVARVHSVQQGEMDNLSRERIISRYLRSVRERNARILYIRPVLEGSEDLLEYNAALIQNLILSLEKQGFVVGDPGYFQPLQTPNWILLFIWAFIIGLGIYCLTFFIKLPQFWKQVLFWSGLFLGILILFGISRIIFLQGALLAIAIIIPALAVLWVLKQRNGPWWIDWLYMLGITLLGAFFIAALSSERFFLLGLASFRGIKLALVFPLLFIGYFLYRERFAGRLREMLFSWPVALSIVLLGMALFIYITRSGNFPVLPVPVWEVALREFLEETLLIRPRFKEFMWGHPFMVAGLYLFRQQKWPWISSLFLLLGSMGLITILNSFTHFHTPLWVSIWRTILGAGLGLALGFILTGCIQGLGRIIRRRFLP